MKIMWIHANIKKGFYFKTNQSFYNLKSLLKTIIFFKYFTGFNLAWQNFSHKSIFKFRNSHFFLKFKKKNKHKKWHLKNCQYANKVIKLKTNKKPTKKMEKKMYDTFWNLIYIQSHKLSMRHNKFITCHRKLLSY